MNITRLVCDACGATINNSSQKFVMQCPYCGSKYLVESPFLQDEVSPSEVIHKLLSSAKNSKFTNLNTTSQDQIIDELIQLIMKNRLIDAIRNIRIYTGLGLVEARGIVEKIPAIIIKK